ncbi:MAG: triphosphoribosyl-dephospho-CoA synthase, partial [Candidatus Bathyarchaeia archaeon]
MNILEPDRVASALQLAMLLEVSGYPKPGNVHRTRDFKDTRFEHFLASASALYQVWRMGAQRGLHLSMGARRLVYGDLILKGCREMMGWQRGGNTSLGVILLLTPMSLAAGLSIRLSHLTAQTLRENICKVLNSG